MKKNQNKYFSVLQVLHKVEENQNNEIFENSEVEDFEFSNVKDKKVDGDIAAIHLLLKNIDRDNWADNPQGIRIKEQELELRRQIAEAQNFDFKE